jgi:trehalose-6-phosphate synthase/Kef-type K+ transport system membrane component KefB
MRRLAALVIAMSLAGFVVSEAGAQSVGATALGLGVALVAAAVVGWLCEFVRLPRIIGYLVFGLLCGPSVGNIITDPMARDLQAASRFAVVVIAVIAGLNLNVGRLRARIAPVVGVTAITVTAAWVALASVLYVVWPWLPVAGQLVGLERVAAVALAATLLVAASPPVTIAVIAESRARGSLTDLATEVVVLMEVAVVLLFTLVQQGSHVVFGTGVDVAALGLSALWSVVGSLAVGTLLGALFTIYLRVVGREITVVLIALCALLTGVTAPLGHEPFLAGLAAGLVVQNAMPATGDVLRDAMAHGAMPVLILFFATVGASMHVEAVATIGVVAVALTLVRLVSIRAATAVAARTAGRRLPTAGLVWRALIPTGGATIGLAAAIAAQHSTWAVELQALIVAVVALNQLIGPILFRASLEEAGEVGRSGGGLVVVSNREPWVHDRQPDGSIVARPTPGGVSVALDALMRERGGVWIAHGSGSADRDVVDEQSSIEVPPEAPAYRLRRLWLTPLQEERYYAGFSNSALWPLCHQAHVRPVFKAEDWEAYQDVNRLFAEAAAFEAPPESSVFLNDYHLALVARNLRARRPLLRTALFWHIPWPDVDRLRICPWRREIVEGLLANDLLAFQLPRDQRNFLSAVTDEIGAPVSGDVVYAGDRQVRVLSIPIGADFDRITTILADGTLPATMDELSAELKLGDRVVGIGVDRLDYTKGIPERIAALSQLLREQPQLVGRFVFVQVGVPSRADVPGYAEISAEIDRLVASANEEFTQGPGTEPILYVKATWQMPRLVALYRLADFCIVSSLHDGMNLVAKEFVAARDDLDGVLILSELAGASEELAEALIINPYDERGFTAAIARAVEMPVWERRRRMQALRRRVAGRDVLAWASDILSRLERRKGAGFLSG